MKLLDLKNCLRFGVIAVLCSFFITEVKSQSPPTLGTTAPFALFTADGAFNNVGTSVVTGDVGTDVGAFNFGTGVLIGNMHVVDGVSASAATDVDVAYAYLDGLGGGTTIISILDGQILTPGLYTIGSAASLSTNLTLEWCGRS